MPNKTKDPGKFGLARKTHITMLILSIAAIPFTFDYYSTASNQEVINSITERKEAALYVSVAHNELHETYSRLISDSNDGSKLLTTGPDQFQRSKKPYSSSLDQSDLDSLFSKDVEEFLGKSLAAISRVQSNSAGCRFGCRERKPTFLDSISLEVLVQGVKDKSSFQDLSSDDLTVLTVASLSRKLKKDSESQKYEFQQSLTFSEKLISQLFLSTSLISVVDRYGIVKIVSGMGSAELVNYVNELSVSQDQQRKLLETRLAGFPFPGLGLKLKSGVYLILYIFIVFSLYVYLDRFTKFAPNIGTDSRDQSTWLVISLLLSKGKRDQIFGFCYLFLPMFVSMAAIVTMIFNPIQLRGFGWTLDDTRLLYVFVGFFVAVLYALFSFSLLTRIRS